MTLLQMTFDAYVSPVHPATSSHYALRPLANNLRTQRNTAPKFQGENLFNNKAIVDELKKIAQRKGCSTPQVALAWVAAQGFIPIPGTTKAKRLEENFASRGIDFTEEEKQEMRKLVDAAKPTGHRYGPAAAAMVGH